MAMNSIVKDVKLQYDAYLRQLLPYSYNILGDSMLAEDVVQDVLNGYFLKSTDHVEKPLVYLTKSVVNRSINEKKRQNRIKRDNYNGQWLPSPVYTEDGLYRDLDRTRVANFALMVLLEKLNPKERAVFILRESYGFSHDEVAETIDISVENSRQLFRRAQQKLEQSEHKLLTVNSSKSDAADELSRALVDGDLDRLMGLLSADVVSVSDGGDKVRTARNIVRGNEHVLKLLQAIFTKYMPAGATYDHTTLNHLPAIRFWLEGRVFRTIVLEPRNGMIETVYITVNPDKLISL